LERAQPTGSFAGYLQGVVGALEAAAALVVAPHLSEAQDDDLRERRDSRTERQFQKDVSLKMLCVD
jgi:hypothetical protein